MDIAELLSQGDGPRVAFVRERFRLDELAETLVAFANGHGGTALIGVGPRGKPEGVQNVAAARDAVLQAALSCTPPLILPMPVSVDVAEGVLLAVEVPPGMHHVYSLHGKYLRREGSRNQPLPPDALRRLLSDRGELAWERLVPEDASLDQLDTTRMAGYVRRLGPVAEDDPLAFLYRRGCLDRRNGAYVPTQAGLLLFGVDVERRYPQAEVVLVRYRGNDMADIFEREDVRDPLPEAIRRAERWLIEHMRKGSRMVGLERQDWTQFPAAVVREVLVNAVAHRDYTVRGEGIRVALFDDRLECYSPGRLPGHVTLENLREERYSRNETLVQVLADMGMIERLGYGIDRMFQQMEQAGLPPPQFRETAAGFLVTLIGQTEGLPASGVDVREWQRMGLNERQVAALLHITEHRRITNRDLQELAPDVSAETIRRDLNDLVERGFLLKIGDKRATYYIVK